MIVISLILFYFLQTLSFGLRQTEYNKYSPTQANQPIQPECPGSSQTTIQHRESIGQYKAGRPQSESANRHGNSTNTVREISEIMTHITVAKVMA